MSYPSANPGPPHQGSPRNGLGVAALVLGIIALLTFWTVLGGIVLGLVALVLGIIGFRRQKQGVATNGTMAIVGAVLGLLGIIASVVILAVGVSFLNSEEFGNLTECLEQAETTQEQEDCQREFSDQVGR
ncbi:DUF4190 domain-containing protein [Streptomyces sp. 549]|uniref:DUF4190 domain-containing protein n=1 Tax=Streptomyces sp. 549 TaxID=3049076 RepID=UPI0024C39B78|nr:DUF4190 domain-containing protein [Streptomyces sp. 549]MDK1473298.1 DUF4190 domain-containing protein [Streptomyces sp. 549]